MIGPRLASMMESVGLEDVHERVVRNPITTERDKLFLADLVPNMRAAMLSAGAATSDELDQLHADLLSAAADNSTVWHQALIYQVSGRRPGGSS